MRKAQKKNRMTSASLHKQYDPLLDSIKELNEKRRLREFPYLIRDVMDCEMTSQDIFEDEPSAMKRWLAFTEITEIAGIDPASAQETIPALMINYESFGIVTKCLVAETLSSILTGDEKLDDIKRLFGKRLLLLIHDKDNENEQLNQRVNNVLERLTPTLFGTPVATPSPIPGEYGYC